MKKPQGTVQEVHALIERGRLKVRLSVSLAEGEPQQAYLPDREVSALLPRSLFVARTAEAPQELLSPIASVPSSSVRGRKVRLWRYQQRCYASFPRWRSVRFAALQAPEPGM
jgi:hypothetical protein